ncbi:NAD(P)/FAD-dependent oxidoreductase [Pimelobacter simplex]|uniref:NAD(P)/FAD-dependent oxidoreductase n=1 Tax=Nocardioides simplex TaxID=2045 RepID=UPI003AB031F9
MVTPRPLRPRGDASDVVVIGGGVIGLSTALHLRLGGAEVTLVEAGPIGAGASRRNAGWLVPSMCEPVPSPAGLRTALRWLGRRGGPLKVGFEPSWSYLTFLTRMLLASRSSAYQRGLAATAALASHAIDAFDELAALGIEFERHRDGVLLLFVQEHGIQPHLDDLAAIERYGFPRAEALTGRDVRDLEPTVGPGVIGGILCPGDERVDPDSLTDALTARCVEAGVRIRTDAPVTEIEAGRGGTTVVAGGVRHRAGSVVLAAGVGTRRLTAQLGIRVNIRAGKGYGFDYGPAPLGLRCAVYLSDHKVAVTPLDRGIRLAGTMEFGAEDLRVDERRAAAIPAAMAHYFPTWPASRPRPWTGLRPMTSDGLPVIGRVSPAPVYVAAGHAMLGVTLGPLTGKLLSESILTGTEPALLRPFGLDRFRVLPHRDRSSVAEGVPWG